MNKYLFLLTILIFFVACDTSSTTSAPPATPEPVEKPVSEPAPAPPADSERVFAVNDLNGDGMEDHLEILTTSEDNDGLGFKRQLIVYSGEGADRDAWYTAEDVILSTEHGGMMGDPLQGADIENGTIVVRHEGGSRQKWTYTHRFRWQKEDFQLIGATVVFGAPCEYFVDFDYNLSTGKATWEKTTEDCDSTEETPVDKLNFKEVLAQPRSMDGFYPGDNAIAIPGKEASVYY